jgi:hypothetical protein
MNNKAFCNSEKTKRQESKTRKKYKSVNEVSCPISVGMVPERWFPDRYLPKKNNEVSKLGSGKKSEAKWWYKKVNEVSCPSCGEIEPAKLRSSRFLCTKKKDEC